MRLTDDYLIISDKKIVVEEIIENLFKCSDENNFKFNKKKLKANFKKKDFQLIEDCTKFPWIGKIINLKTMEINHT